MYKQMPKKCVKKPTARGTFLQHVFSKCLTHSDIIYHLQSLWHRIVLTAKLNPLGHYKWINQLSNTTIWWLDICCFLHRYQLHVSALMAIFRFIDWQQNCKQLYFGMRLMYGGGGLGLDGGTRSRVCWVGRWCGCMGTIVPAGTTVPMHRTTVPMHPHHPPYSTHARSRTPIQPQPPSTIHKTHAKV